MELEDQEVVKYLTGWNTVRDGSLVALRVDFSTPDPVIKLDFQVERDGVVRKVGLTLSGVQQFDYSYSSEYRMYISHLKCLWTADGQFFISLDPRDEREDFVSDLDNDCFRSSSVTLVTEEVSG